jgi:small GTP-binding protein
MPPAKLKIVCIGDSSVGKTCFLKRLVNNSYDEGTEATIGVDRFNYTFDAEALAQYPAAAGEGVELSVFDTSGSSKFQTMCTSRYRSADGFVCAFDITNRDSFASLSGPQSYLGDIKKFSCTPHGVLIVGCKCDLAAKRVVTEEEVRLLVEAQGENAAYIEISAKTNDNVKEAMEELCRLWLEGEAGEARLAESVQPLQAGSGGCCAIA